MYLREKLYNVHKHNIIMNKNIIFSNWDFRKQTKNIFYSKKKKIVLPKKVATIPC